VRERERRGNGGGRRGEIERGRDKTSNRRTKEREGGENGIQNEMYIEKRKGLKDALGNVCKRV